MMRTKKFQFIFVAFVFCIFGSVLCTQQCLPPDKKAQIANPGNDRLRHMIEHKELYSQETQHTIKVMLKQVPVGENDPVKYLKRIKEFALEERSELVSEKDNTWRYLSIQDLTPFASLTQLTSLNLSLNEIHDLKPIDGLIQLKKLKLWGNLIQDLTPLANLTGLKELSLGSNQIQDLSPLAGLTQLEELDLSGNHQIQDITPLANLTQKLILSLDAEQIQRLKQYKGLPKNIEVREVKRPEVVSFDMDDPT